jgi:pilus assembly protein CpaE
VVVDTPAALTEVVLAAFDLSDTLYTMATLDLPSVRNMGVFLNQLERLKIPADNIKLILNKAERDVGIDVDQVTRLFPKQFSAVLPYAREVSRSINLGMPVMASSPGAEVSRLMAGGLMELLPPDVRARVDQTPASRGGFLGRLFRR